MKRKIAQKLFIPAIILILVVVASCLVIADTPMDGESIKRILSEIQQAVERDKAEQALPTITGVSSAALRIVSYTISRETPGFYNAVYTSREGFHLRTGTTEKASSDNGRTWKPDTMTPNYRVGLPYGYRRQEMSSVLETLSGRLIAIVNALDTPGIDPKIHEPSIAQQSFYLRYHVSDIGAKRWLFDEPIIQAGIYTQANPLEGVYIGKNSIYLGDFGCIPISTKSGHILVPTQTNPIGPDGKLWNPTNSSTYTDVLVLIGTWRSDNHLSWKVSQRVMGDPKRSTRGLFEPTLAEFPDGRILMVMRGSNGGKSDPKFELPSYKWFSVSDDGGKTWIKPQPWTFEDGEPFYSPSAMSALFKHSSGRFFWIGNLNSKNSKGNGPRWPLVIGEVNPKSLKLIHKSVLVVDTEQAEDKPKGRLDLSHFTLLEDRETKEIVLVYPRNHNAYKFREWATVRLAVK